MKKVMQCPKCKKLYHDYQNTCVDCDCDLVETLESYNAEDQVYNSDENFGLDDSSISKASGLDLDYVVLQVTLKEKLIGTGSGNLVELEEVINAQVKKGYRLHTITTTNGGSKGMLGGERIQATLVFEKLSLGK